MRFPRASGMLSLVAFALIASSTAMAQDTGWYLGLNLGRTKAKIDDERIISSLVPAGLTVTSLKDNDTGTGFKVFGGYQFNRYFAFEGGYLNLGKAGYDATTLPAGTLSGELKADGFNVDAVLSLPFTQRFSVFGRVGVASIEAKDTFVGTGPVVVTHPNPSERSTNIKFGGGLQYDFTKSFAVRAELERYRLSDAIGNKGDIDLASIGLLFKFGRKPAPAPYVVPPPAPAVYTPEPYVAPAAVVVPVADKTEQYCTLLDLTFDIDRQQLERDDMEKLAVIGTFLTKYPGTTAVIEGHTDNVGSEEHNLRLSKARAESVVTYLVDTLHVDRRRLSAVGYGWARPVADNATDEGKRQNRRINAVVSCVTDLEGLTVKPARTTIAVEIEFDLLKDEVKPEYRESLHRVANFLKANRDVTATVEGHAGKVKTTEASAMAISKRRAENVVTYLVDNFGIDRSRLTAEGFGKTRRFAYSDTPEHQQENRRVNIIINYPSSKKN